MVDASKKQFYENQANTIIKKLANRKMEGYYCSTMDEAKEKVLELIGEPAKTVAYGGSMAIDNTDLKQQIRDAGHDLIVREEVAHDDPAWKDIKAKIINADTFLMSSNAITLNGELINIDGFGDRVSFLIYGPEQVVLLVGMNKVVPDVDSGIKRVRNVATPANTVRLNCDTPCAKIGRCADCLPNTICCQVVVTRSSLIPGRIKVVLVGEDVGF